jgi:hypothetical protein
MLEVLLPVVIGGLIAIVGGLVGPTFVDRVKAKTERQRRRAEKFEELVLALYEHRHWMERARVIRVFSDNDVVEASPIAKVETISAIYFPEFREQISNLDILADRYELWMIEARRKRLHNVANYADGATDVFGPYSEASLKLLKEMREFAKREFQ